MRIMAIKGHSMFPITLEVKPYHQMQFHVIFRTVILHLTIRWFSVISRKLVWGGSWGLTPLQRCSSCIHFTQTVLIQTIQLSLSTVSMSKTVLFQTIQFWISMQFSFIWPIDRTLSCTTTLGLNGPLSDGNEGVLCIPQSSSITRTLPSDCLVS